MSTEPVVPVYTLGLKEIAAAVSMVVKEVNAIGKELRRIHAELEEIKTVISKRPK